MKLNILYFLLLLGILSACSKSTDAIQDSQKYLLNGFNVEITSSDISFQPRYLQTSIEMGGECESGTGRFYFSLQELDGLGVSLEVDEQLPATMQYTLDSHLQEPGVLEYDVSTSRQKYVPGDTNPFAFFEVLYGTEMEFHVKDGSSCHTTGYNPVQSNSSTGGTTCTDGVEIPQVQNVDIQFFQVPTQQAPDLSLAFTVNFEDNSYLEVRIAGKSKIKECAKLSTGFIE